MRGATRVPYCPTCGHLTSLQEGERHCSRCERAAETRAAERQQAMAHAYADLQAQFRAHLAGQAWCEEDWLRAHRIVVGV